MATPPTPRDELARCATLAKEHGIAGAARLLGMPRSSLQGRLRVWQRLHSDEPLVAPLPDDDIPIEEILAIQARRFEKRAGRDAAAKWFPVRIPEKLPIGLLFVGDVHIDDNGCNTPLLLEHVEIAKQPGVYAVNQGDTINAWAGRLARLYANQDTSLKTARRLAYWLFNEAGIRWAVILLGNHDTGGGEEGLFRSMTTPRIHVEDWRAQFKLVFPNGRECKIDAAHSFKGHSQYNALHGAQKAALWGESAHIYAAGHHHEFALAQHENAERGHVYWLIKARGYKYLDDYAKHNGFPQQRYGASVMAVIDPLAKDDSRFVTCFADPAEGAEYLTWKRAKA